VLRLRPYGLGIVGAGGFACAIGVQVHEFAAFGVLPEKVAVWQGSKNQEKGRNIPAVQRWAAVGVSLLCPDLRAKRLAARQVRGHSFKKARKRGRTQQNKKSFQGSLPPQHKKQPPFFRYSHKTETERKLFMEHSRTGRLF